MGTSEPSNEALAIHEAVMCEGNWPHVIDPHLDALRQSLAHSETMNAGLLGDVAAMTKRLAEYEAFPGVPKQVLDADAICEQRDDLQRQLAEAREREGRWRGLCQRARLFARIVECQASIDVNDTIKAEGWIEDHATLATSVPAPATGGQQEGRA